MTYSWVFVLTGLVIGWLIGYAGGKAVNKLRKK